MSRKDPKGSSVGSELNRFGRTASVSTLPYQITGPEPDRGSSTSSNSSGLMTVLRKSVRRYQNCQECGDSTEKTIHCVHCGLVLCEKDRNRHVKELIEELRTLKVTSSKHLKSATDKKDRITQTIIDTEHSRTLAKHRINEEFQQIQDLLTSRKKELHEKIDSFGKDELKLLNDDKILLDQYLKDLRAIELDFHPKLANYTGMHDSSLAKLCQTKLQYQDCMMWIQSLVDKDDTFVPIVFEGSQDFRDACCSFGSIGYGRAKRFLERRKSYTSLKIGSENSGLTSRPSSTMSTASSCRFDYDDDEDLRSTSSVNGDSSELQPINNGIHLEAGGPVQSTKKEAYDLEETTPTATFNAIRSNRDVSKTSGLNKSTPNLTKSESLSSSRQRLSVNRKSFNGPPA